MVSVHGTEERSLEICSAISGASSKPRKHLRFDALPCGCVGETDVGDLTVSNQVVQILNYLGVEYKSANVLADPALREGIKVYTNWPTIPQLYVKGEFVGGADIVREMFQAGELQSHLQTKGIKVAAPTS